MKSHKRSHKKVGVEMEHETMEKERTRHTNKTRSQGLIGALVFVSVFAVVFAGGIFGYLKIKEKKSPVVSEVKTEEVVKKSKYPPLPLAQGPRTFRMSHGKAMTGPKIGTVKVSALDPGMNGLQNVEVTISHDSPITSVMANVKTDNKITSYSLRRVSGTDMDGVWVGEWNITDTYENRYAIQFDIKSKTTSFVGGLTLR